MDNIQMGKKVIVSVVGIQKYEDDEDSIEVVAPGQYYKKNNKEYITYKERNEDKTQDTLTTIKVDEDKVSVMRFGGINTNMTFELNKKHTTFYDTNQGALTVSVFTKKINIGLDEGKGEIEIMYELEIDHVSMGTNQFHIKVHSTDNKDLRIPVQEFISDEIFINP